MDGRGCLTSLFRTYRYTRLIWIEENVIREKFRSYSSCSNFQYIKQLLFVCVLSNEATRKPQHRLLRNTALLANFHIVTLKWRSYLKEREVAAWDDGRNAFSFSCFFSLWVSFSKKANHQWEIVNRFSCFCAKRPANLNSLRETLCENCWWFNSSCLRRPAVSPL